MKKLFISAPMKGRTEAQIRATMEQMHHIAEAVFGEELEVIQTYISDDLRLMRIRQSGTSVRASRRWRMQTTLSGSTIRRRGCAFVQHPELCDQLGFCSP